MAVPREPRSLSPLPERSPWTATPHPFAADWQIIEKGLPVCPGGRSPGSRHWLILCFGVLMIPPRRGQEGQNPETQNEPTFLAFMPEPTYNPIMSTVDRPPKPLAWLQGEIKTPPFTAVARLEAGVLLRRLQDGESPGMPHSRPMPSIGLAVP
jgi:hypothetical protein